MGDGRKTGRNVLVAVLVAAVLALLGLAGWLASGTDARTGRPRPERPVASGASPKRPVRKRPSRPAPAPTPEVVAEELPEGSVRVRCTVGDVFDGWPMLDVRLFRGPDRVEPVGFQLEDGVLAFVADQGATRAVVTWGMGPDAMGVAHWDDGECRLTDLPKPISSALYGRVRGAERLDDGTVFLEGCGIDQRGEPAPIDVDGGFFVPVAEGRCRIRAWRQAGALRLPGDWVEVDARAAVDAEVSLAVPTFAPAGMGVGFRTESDGVVVEQVHEGTPAWDVGLEAGDTIATIDGAPTDGMGMEDFLRKAIGPEGTEVHLTGTTAEGEPFDVTFHRKPIHVN